MDSERLTPAERDLLAAVGVQVGPDGRFSPAVLRDLTGRLLAETEIRITSAQEQLRVLTAMRTRLQARLITTDQRG